ncbi:chemotaxis protein CheW [Paramagnetospirillum kuznetsovii]|uniref:chemotaxis protein CheW n=1 Tax=Paramagnetospirillum kuznetsovii TaxID=2053833 RepID=UPI001EFE6305|nr:chemotaxis protein CheW [Paramagnetospirillum kuznetsovii]
MSGLNGVVTFRLCGQVFGLPVEAVREVVPIAWLDRPPQTPSMVQGVLNLGGRAVPVLRLDRLLGLGDGTYGIDASILIMRAVEGEQPLGLLVEHVDGVRPMDGFTTMGFFDGVTFNGCLADQLDFGGQVVQLLAWRNLLLAEERHRLADFQAMTQARLAELGDAAP